MKTGLVVIVGTGTGVGKTYVTRALAKALRAAGHTVLAYKPLESGAVPGAAEDVDALAAVSSPFPGEVLAPLLLPAPISPHLAARQAGVTWNPAAMLEFVAAAREHVLVLVEFPGGLFSPLAEVPGEAGRPMSALFAGELISKLLPDATLLVAPDRLGVLHDLAATTRAARLEAVPLTGIVLSAPAVSDASTGSNAREIPLVTPLPVLAELPHAPIDPERALAPLLEMLNAL